MSFALFKPCLRLYYISSAPLHVLRPYFYRQLDSRAGSRFLTARRLPFDMPSLSQALIANHEEITQRWYEMWRRSEHPHPEIREAALKDHLSPQLRLIGEQLRDLRQAEPPTQIWQVYKRLDPEARVDQEIPIEEVVQEYGLALDTISRWIRERGLEPTFDELTYLHQALFELTAESVRRYEAHRGEQIRQERSIYLAGLTHQMRTPLSTLIMQLQLLERQGQIAPSLVDQLRRNLRRLSYMVNSVMRLERFKPHELPVRPRLVYPARLIDQALDDRQPEARHKGLRLESDVNRTLEMQIDPDLFIDVMGNLVDNAVKYTPSGFVRVEAKEEPDAVLFKVLDSGPGIAPERQAGLFGAVQPGEQSGAGIGLHVAYRAVTAMGGSIGIESELGHGAMVWFRLPRR